MAIKNLGATHPTAAQKTAIDSALNTTITTVTAIAPPSFSATERENYGSINEKNKLLVNKVNDYHTNQPALDNPKIDWAEFINDFGTRAWAEAKLAQLETLKKMLEDVKIAHDYDNYHDALRDYAYTQVMADNDEPGFAAKRDDLKQFF